MAKFKLVNVVINILHCRTNFSLSVMLSHLLYNFLFLLIVLFISWMAALFFAAWPSSQSFLNELKDFLNVLSTKLLNPFSNLVALFLPSVSTCSGKLLISLKASATLPALDINNFVKNLFWTYLTLFSSSRTFFQFLKDDNLRLSAASISFLAQSIYNLFLSFKSDPLDFI